MPLQEFEVIAQIKLLQSACNSYCLTADPAFLRWFKGQPQLSEEERYTLYSEYLFYFHCTVIHVIISKLVHESWSAGSIVPPQIHQSSFVLSFLIVSPC